jgi:hypothetical protein
MDYLKLGLRFSLAQGHITPMSCQTVLMTVKDDTQGTESWML